MTLEEALAIARQEAAVMERCGGAYQPRAVQSMLDAIERAAEDYLLWLPESTAMVRTGRSRRWLRAHFAGWMDQGHGRMVNGERQYRALVLPRRANPSAILSGDVSRGSCYVAGCAGKTEAHHDDYSRPLAVVWTCRAHHRALDRARRESAILTVAAHVGRGRAA